MKPSLGLLISKIFNKYDKIFYKLFKKTLGIALISFIYDVTPHIYIYMMVLKVYSSYIYGFFGSFIN